MFRSAISLILAFASVSLADEGPKVETRQKIVVIETRISKELLSAPYMCLDGSISALTNRSSTYEKAIGWEVHGTNVVGLIGTRIDSSKYCIEHIAYYSEEDVDSSDNAYFKALSMTTEIKNVVAVNLSIIGSHPVPIESRILRLMNSKGIAIITAAGNKGATLTKASCTAYPACLQPDMPNPEDFYVVASKSGKDYSSFSNRSKFLTVFSENGEDQGFPPLYGTSQSAAIFTGNLFSKAQNGN